MRLNVDVYLHLSNSALFPIYEKNKQLGFGKGLFGRLWLFAGDLWSLAGGLWSFAGGLWSFLVVCGRLWSFAGVLWSFAVVACYSNYDFQNNFWKRKCIFHCFYTMAKRAFSINLNVNHQKIEIRWFTENSNKNVFFG